MLVLVAVGVMNIAAMAVLAAVIFLEKLWSHGAGLSRAVGFAFLAIAVLVPFFPSLLPGLRGAMMTTGGM
jgi:predicted metal-binding membrane protein